MLLEPSIVMNANATFNFEIEPRDMSSTSVRRALSHILHSLIPHKLTLLVEGGRLGAGATRHNLATLPHDLLLRVVVDLVNLLPNR